MPKTQFVTDELASRQVVMQLLSLFAGLALLLAAIPVAESVRFADGWHFSDLSASNTGGLLYGAGNTALSRLTWLRRDGTLLENVSEPDWFRSLRLSPDGRRAVIERGIARALWMMNFERNVLTRMTFEQGLSGWAA